MERKCKPGVRNVGTSNRFTWKLGVAEREILKNALALEDNSHVITIGTYKLLDKQVVLSRMGLSSVLLVAWKERMRARAMVKEIVSLHAKESVGNETVDNKKAALLV